MANQTVTVLEADGATQTDVEVLGFGRQAAAASKSVALSTEDAAKVPAALGAGGGMKVQVYTAAGTAVDPVPAGSAAMAASVPVTLATDDTIKVPLAGVAHDAADTGNPIKVGAKATAGLSGATLVAAADRTNLSSNLDGAINVRTVPLEDIVSGNTSNTDGTLTEVIAAAAAGIKQYLTRISLSNAHASTVAIVDIKSATTIKYTVAVPPGGREIFFDPPLPPSAAAEAWNFDPQAAVTTLYCAMVGFKSKV